jgi:hypothetical protein
MVEQRRKDPGRKGRPADRGGKTRRSRPAAGRRHGAARGRGRGRPVRTRGEGAKAGRAATRGRPSRGTRSRRSAARGLRTVVPSDRWRPMKRVGGDPAGSAEEPSPSERPTQQADQQTEQTPPRHGIIGRLFQRGG